MHLSTKIELQVVNTVTFKLFREVSSLLSLTILIAKPDCLSMPLMSISPSLISFFLDESDSINSFCFFYNRDFKL